MALTGSKIEIIDDEVGNGLKRHPRNLSMREQATIGGAKYRAQMLLHSDGQPVTAALERA